MHFMRDNLLDTEDFTVSPTAATQLTDGLFENYYAITSASQEIRLTFTSPVSFQRLWLKTEFISSWTAVSGADTIAFATEIGDGEVSSFHEVSVENQTVVTFEFTKAAGQMEGRIFEIMLMPLHFKLDNSQRPMRFAVTDGDPGGLEYRSENATLISYAGQSEGKAVLMVGWDFMPKRFTDQLRKLFYGPPIRKPFIIFPEPDDNPDDIYRVYWKNNFERVPSGETLVAGYTVNMLLWET